MTSTKIEKKKVPIPMYGKILVFPFDLLEKRRHQLTEDVELEIENKFNTNLRERNPQTAIVVGVFNGCEDIQVGDKILLYHFIFSDGNGDKTPPNFVYEGEGYYSVPYSECFFVLDEAGEIKSPIGEYLLCEVVSENVEKETPSGIVLPMAKQPKKEDRDLQVIMKGNSELVENGDLIRALYHYEVTINKKKYIRIKEEYILGKLIEHD